MTPARMYRTILIAITGLLTAAALTVRADAESNPHHVSVEIQGNYITER